jgi:hypothetical protein
MLWLQTAGEMYHSGFRYDETITVFLLEDFCYNFYSFSYFLKVFTIIFILFFVLKGIYIIFILSYSILFSGYH